MFRRFLHDLEDRRAVCRIPEQFAIITVYSRRLQSSV